MKKPNSRPWAARLATTLLLVAVGAGLWAKKPHGPPPAPGAEPTRSASLPPRTAHALSVVSNAPIAKPSDEARREGADGFTGERAEPNAFELRLASERYPEGVDLDGSSSLEVRVRNGHRVGGTVLFEATSGHGDAGLSRTRFHRLRIPPASELAVALPVAELGLTSTQAEYSGELSIGARIELDGALGTELAGTPLQLFFHAREAPGSGWRVYDRRIARERYHSGALTASAREQRVRELAKVPGLAEKIFTAPIYRWLGRNEVAEKAPPAE